jgi:hypothetical protein
MSDNRIPSGKEYNDLKTSRCCRNNFYLEMEKYPDNPFSFGKEYKIFNVFINDIFPI